MLDIEPAAASVADLIRGLSDASLDESTPIGGTIGELLDHIQSLSRAFTAAAVKSIDHLSDGPPPKPDASRLPPNWRQEIPALLDELAVAWKEPAAWEGTTKVGGLEMPGDVAGVVALDEIVLHGWDLAVASGQTYDPPAQLLDALLPFLEQVSAPGMEAAREGLFGPVVSVGEDAPLVHRVLGLAGRDPRGIMR